MAKFRITSVPQNKKLNTFAEGGEPCPRGYVRDASGKCVPYNFNDVQAADSYKGMYGGYDKKGVKNLKQEIIVAKKGKKFSDYVLRGGKTKADMAKKLGKDAGQYFGMPGEALQPTNFTKAGLEKYNKTIKDAKKNFEAEEKNREEYDNALKKKESGKMSTDKFARQYKEKGWADKYDPATMKEGYRGQFQDAVNEANARKEANMGVTLTALELMGGGAYRVFADPIGTAKGVGQTVGDIATLPFGLATGVYNYATDGNFDMGTNAWGDSYGKGLSQTGDVLSAIPGLGAAGKLAKFTKAADLAGDIGKGFKTIGTKLDQKIYPTRAYRSEGFAVDPERFSTTDNATKQLAEKVGKKGDWATKDLEETYQYLRGLGFDESQGLLSGKNVKFTEYKLPFWKKDISADPDVIALKKLQGTKINSNEYIVPGNTALDRFLYPRRTNIIKGIPEHVKSQKIYPSKFPEGIQTYYKGTIPMNVESETLSSPAYKYVEDQLNAVTGHEMPITHEWNSNYFPIKDWQQPQFAPNKGVGKFTRFSSSLPGSPNAVNNAQEIQKLFNTTSELSKLGTIEDYTQHLDEIFPNANIKDLMYHQTFAKKFDAFKESPMGANYFSFFDVPTGGNFAPLFRKLGSNKVLAKVNVNNPFIINKNNYSAVKKATGLSTQDVNKLKESFDLSKNDAVLGFPNPRLDKGELDNFPQINFIDGRRGDLIELGVMDPKNTHILGSKPDIELFKKFMDNKLAGSPNASISGRLKQFFDRPPGPLMLGMPTGSSGNMVKKNIPYYEQLLNTYDSKVMSATNKKFYKDLIGTAKMQDGMLTEAQLRELDRLKTGNFDFGKRGYAKGGTTNDYIEMDIPKSKVQWYIDNGYDVEVLE